MNTAALQRSASLWPLALLAVLALGAAWLPPLQQAESLAEGAGARPQTKVTVLSCEPLAEVPGRVMTSVLVDFPPGAYTPAHRHPGALTAYVLRGQVRSRMEGEPPHTYGVGQTWFEPSGALHLFAENASRDEPAQLLATFVTDEGCGPLTIPEDHPHSS